MFGMFRPPPSPPDCLETSAAKISKHDSLSVYESTLLKLKQGSRLDHSSYPETSSVILSEAEGESLSDVSTSAGIHVIPCLAEDPMAIDSVSNDCKSGKGSSKQQKNRNTPVLCLFSRYKRALISGRANGG